MSANKSKNAEEIDAIIGKKLRDLRIKNGKTLKEAGEVVGVVHSTFHGYEKGTRSLSAYKIALLLDYYNKDMNEFFKEVIEESKK